MRPLRGDSARPKGGSERPKLRAEWNSRPAGILRGIAGCHRAIVGGRQGQPKSCQSCRSWGSHEADPRLRCGMDRGNASSAPSRTEADGEEPTKGSPK